jgi:hypothetical protein
VYIVKHEPKHWRPERWPKECRLIEKAFRH